PGRHGDRDLYLAVDCTGDPQLAARLRRRPPAQPRGRRNRRFPLSDYRAGAASDPRVSAEFRQDRHLADHPDPAFVLSARPDHRGPCAPPPLLTRPAEMPLTLASDGVRILV